MKKIVLLTFSMFLGVLFLSAQNWNPFVEQASVSPAAFLPRELNGTGVFSFHVGNSGSDLVTFERATVNNKLTLVITLSYGVPDKTDPVAALGGTWKSKFDWTYDAGIKTYTATQNQVIPGSTPGNPSEGTITIQYKVTQNSSMGAPQNGFNANLQPPPYCNGVNKLDDDVRLFAYVEAIDYGDAPVSYGSAGHIMDPDNLIYLGSMVDYDAADQESPAAKGDDISGADDEDGVTFPTLIPGTTVTIPVVVTTTNNSSGFINTWIDWNGNGNFDDTGEQIAINIPVAASGTVNLTGITVPMNVVITKPTFARFRIGPVNTTNTGSCTSGEVEDFQIQIFNPAYGIENKEGSQRLMIYSDENNIYVKDLTGKELIGKMTVYNLVGQKIAKKALTGGILNKFPMTVEMGYYVVEVSDDGETYCTMVYLTTQ